jgi:hypothetical protein
LNNDGLPACAVSVGQQLELENESQCSVLGCCVFLATRLPYTPFMFLRRIWGAALALPHPPMSSFFARSKYQVLSTSTTRPASASNSRDSLLWQSWHPSYLRYVIGLGFDHNPRVPHTFTLCPSYPLTWEVSALTTGFQPPLPFPLASYCELPSTYCTHAYYASSSRSD